MLDAHLRKCGREIFKMVYENVCDSLGFESDNLGVESNRFTFGHTALYTITFVFRLAKKLVKSGLCQTLS